MARHSNSAEAAVVVPNFRSRGELLQRKALRNGWLLNLGGLLFPLLALGGAYIGFQAARGGRRELGLAMAAVGLAIFSLRLTFAL